MVFVVFLALVFVGVFFFLRAALRCIFACILFSACCGVLSCLDGCCCCCCAFDDLRTHVGVLLFTTLRFGYVFLLYGRALVGYGDLLNLDLDVLLMNCLPLMLAVLSCVNVVCFACVCAVCLWVTYRCLSTACSATSRSSGDAI